MRKTHLNHIPNQAVLAQPIFSENGTILLGAGITLTERFIQRLQLMGIDYVYIEDAVTDDLIPEDVISEKTRRTALDTVHKTLNEISEHPQIKGNKRLTNIGGTYRDLFSSIMNDLLGQKDLIVNLTSIQTCDSYLFHHSVNVAVLAGIMGISLGYKKNELIELGTGALLFDVGMTQIPKELWNKNGKITEEEKKILRTHPIHGYQLLKNQHDVPLLSAHVALQHHERFNGEGYPRNLKGKDIHEYARIVAIADVYDALTSPRQYRSRYSPSEAMEFLQASGNSLFDLDLLQQFVKHIAIYPIATSVLLSTNQVGVVAKIHPDSINRPVVRIIKESTGEVVNPPYEIDLREHLDIVIRSSI